MRENKADYPEVRLVPLKKRLSKVSLKLLGTETQPGVTFKKYWENLPSILAVENLRVLVEKIIQAKAKRKPIIFLFGAHLIKVGLSRYLIALMKKGFVSALATNGASIIHDFELSFGGETSEDVAENLKKGIFGFAKETGRYLNEWVRQAAKNSQGLGRTIGKEIYRSQFPNKNLSLLAKAYEFGIPVSVHVGIGTDIIYQHPNCDGSAWGKTSFEDFKLFTKIVGELGGGGVVMNWGSAVILPEVFLKALAVNKNLGKIFRNLTCANFDIVPQYRPRVNILERPTQEEGSRAFSFVGHHEIMLPLLCQVLTENAQ